MGKELETDRLRLRGWRESDVHPLWAFYRDPASQRVFGGDTTRAESWRCIGLFIGHEAMRGFSPQAIEEKHTGAFVGYAGLWFPEGWGDVEIIYGIAPEHRGKGYATEAAHRARDHGYVELGVARVVSYIHHDNDASIRVARRLGAWPGGEFTIENKALAIYVHPKRTN